MVAGLELRAGPELRLELDLDLGVGLGMGLDRLQDWSSGCDFVDTGAGAGFESGTRDGLGLVAGLELKA